MSLVFILFITPPLIFCMEVAKEQNGDYMLFRVSLEDDSQQKHFQSILAQSQTFTILDNSNLTNQSVDVLVPSNFGKNFESALGNAKLNFKEIISDILNATPNNNNADFNWKNYHDLDTIYSWLRSLTKKYPDVVTLIKGGRSFENRSITGVKICYKSGNKAIIMESGVIAYSWISPATTTYILNELLSSKDPSVRFAAESYDWYFFPVSNPDGYEYTKKDRSWRKNRNPITSNCTGVDLTHNWGYKWMHGGASDEPCSLFYAGSSSFSEVESKTFSEFISSVAHVLEGYISFHSFRQQIMYAFAHDGNEVPPNSDQLLRNGQIAAKAAKLRYGTQYVVGNAFEIHGPGSGVSIDWVTHKYKSVKFSYVYNLRDTGNYGYLLPPEQIIPTAKETLDAIVTLVTQFSKDETKTTG